MEAETQRQVSEKEHQRSAAVFEAAKQKVLFKKITILSLIFQNSFIFLYFSVSVS